MLNVGIISFINALPLTLQLPNYIDDTVQLTLAPPSLLQDMLAKKELDVAFISSAAFLQMEENLELIPDFGIAALHQVMSVKLYFKDHFQQTRYCKIGVTKQSRSSLVLLKILASQFWKIDCQFIPFADQDMAQIIADKTFDAFLLIGDDCLRQQNVEGYHSMDLAEAWYSATGRPFVFALLACHRTAWKEKQGEIFDFLAGLGHCLKNNLKNKDFLVEQALKQLNCPEVSKELLLKYYDLLYYRLNDDMIQGLSLFKELAFSQQLV